MDSLHLDEAFLFLEKSDMTLQKASQKCQVAQTAGYGLTHAAQVAAGFLCCKAHSWLMLNLLSIRTSRSFSAKLSTWSPDLIVAYQAYSLPDMSLGTLF